MIGRTVIHDNSQRQIGEVVGGHFLIKGKFNEFASKIPSSVNERDGRLRKHQFALLKF